MPTERSPTRASTGSTAEKMNPTAEQPTGAHVNKVAVRAPPFWENEPELWYAREVKDVITDPPATDKYLAIKTALIRRLSASQEHRIRQLLEHEEMGDRKPSQFLRNLRTLAGNAVPEQLLRTLWLGRLPTTMQAILATRTQDRLEDVAEQADRIQEVTVRLVNEVKTAPDDPSPMAHQIRQLTDQKQVKGEEENGSPLLLPSEVRATSSKVHPAVQLPVGKRAGESLMAASDTTQTLRRLFVTCQESKRRFLVDTGSDVSVYPRATVQGPKQPTAYILYAANGSAIPTYGWITIEPKLGNHRPRHDGVSQGSQRREFVPPHLSGISRDYPPTHGTNKSRTQHLALHQDNVRTTGSMPSPKTGS
ncbi:uncharacterized protein LOC116847993 [Odontomachus brunneus]|uniref:uncharacterized protein LOC116847993 n=1 Tax=Odontomachus brunneus TaxID=486640 RepID=UPI0013F21177|nr:uncharacterized protein LOC116847993 [Odontomachus brunneus]